MLALKNFKFEMKDVKEFEFKHFLFFTYIKIITRDKPLD